MEIQSFLKRVKFEFYLYSLVALLVTLTVTGLLYSYHSSLIKQQDNVQSLNQHLSEQLQSVVLISDLSGKISAVQSPKNLLELRKRMVEELEKLRDENVSFTQTLQNIEDSQVETELVGIMSNKSLDSKIDDFLYRYKAIEDLPASELRNIQYELSNISNLAYRELFTMFSKARSYLTEEDALFREKIKNIGNYLILFIAFVITMFWGLLFHPIYKKLINQYEKKEQALVNAQIASRAKNDFLANINHEIRTPMMTILGYIELLSVEGILGENEKKEAFRTINENAGQLLKLIDEILDLSKLELGEFNVNFEKVRPKKLFEELRNIISFKSEKKGVELNFNFKTEIPDLVLSDAKRIKQALFNVLNNAVKFTNDGAVDLDVYFNKEESAFTCVVRDTGLGINEKAKDEIFKIFSQENAQFNRHYSGTGLGLALTKKILKELGGDIKLDFSEKGKGSVFSLWFKVKLAQSKSGQISDEKVGESKKLAGKRLLVVDDAVENSLIFQKYLSNAGSHVDVANSGTRALEMIKNADYDLVLLDIQMPELDGYQVLKLLREEKQYFKPVVALTAHAMEDQKKENLRAGFDGHISKPVSSQSLIDSVSSFL